MMKKNIYISLGLLFLPVVVMAQLNQRNQVWTTDTPYVHDPVMAEDESLYYLYSTGQGIQQMTSTDRKTWTMSKPVLSTVPTWTHDSVPGFESHIWAPDVICWHNQWWMAYSCSTFGKNTSAIGLLSCDSLSASDWKDRGCIISSKPNRNLWNAIDPNFVIDDEDKPWLVFGSFWDGIQLVRLDTTLHVLKGEIPHTIARRYGRNEQPTDKNPTSKYAGDNAIEAPFIFHHGDYYYLFVSQDYCCRGMESTYKVAVGRSKSLSEPFVDRKGKDMCDGGGTLLIEGDKKNFEALGHSAAYHFGNLDLFICHGYSIAQHGMSILIQRCIAWDKEGWPKLEILPENLALFLK